MHWLSNCNKRLTIMRNPVRFISNKAVSQKLSTLEGRYAAALFKVTQKTNSLAEVEKDSANILALLAQDPKVSLFVRNPSINALSKIKLFQEILPSLSALTKNLLKVLMENRRLELLGKVLSEFQNMSKPGSRTVTVTSAIDLTESTKKTLGDILRQKFGNEDFVKEVKFNTDPSLIAGMIIELDGATIDIAWDMSMPTCYWDECSTAFESTESLVLHFIEVHMDSIKEPFYCRWKDCSRAVENFCSKSALNTHMRIHTGERPYKCVQCQKTFSRSDALKKHMRNVHDLRKEEPEKKLIKSTSAKKFHSSLLDIRKSLISQLETNREDVRKLRCSKSAILELLCLKK